ncbi:hypothetical protein GCM10009678_20570 [Actinomadura kijaniata]|uniref:ABM domain-containing protein n=1 Tax=Actinomadura namibiensis TaxID=182080 RepID=A0A7W3LIZ3_ACTNM|nr:antibiotic biosynthesis monooxygenase [Actinomadura namibiensis]MBA8949039.1 hypothetical protein [Actinomadura namibiensis]
MTYPDPTRAKHILIERSTAPAPAPPDALTYTHLVGERDGTVLHYSQWPDGESAAAFARARPEARPFTLYRSSQTPGATDPTGCAVLARAVFDSPDPDRQRAWVDALLSLETDDPMPGLLAAHFHLSEDGTEIINYAAWTSREAHRAVMEAPSPDDDPLAAEWERLYTWPGLIHAEAQRFQPL